VLAGHTNSTALGTGAVTTRANQIMMGTGSTTYTMAGIASSASRAAQSGPVQLVTSDANGNLATANASSLGLATQKDLGQLNEGIATVASLAQPILLAGQHFAMRAGWGGYDDASAVGFSAAGVVASNLLSNGRGTLTLDGGVGFGTSEGEVAGRAGASFGW